MVAQQFLCCIYWDFQMCKYPEWPGKSPGARLLVLPWFIVVDLDLRLKMRYLKLELKVLVGWLFWNLIAWLPYTDNDNAEIRLVTTWPRIYRALGTVELKPPQKYLNSLKRATFLESVECVFRFTEKWFRVARDGLNHVPMEGLELKPLIIHLESVKDI